MRRRAGSAGLGASSLRLFPLPFAAALVLATSCSARGDARVVLRDPTTSVRDGWDLVQRSFGRYLGEGAQPFSVLVDVDVDQHRLHVIRFHYLVSRVPVTDRHWLITLDNDTRTLSLESRPARPLMPFAGRWIDLDRLQVDVEQALTIGERNGGGALVARHSSAEILVDLVLCAGESAPAPQRVSVWDLSFDVWTSAGPQTYLNLEIDAITGEVVSSDESIEPTRGG